MYNKSVPLDDRLYRYLLSVTLREPEVLRQLREETASHLLGGMQIAPDQGQFMALLVELIGTHKILEMGVFTGYSSYLWLWPHDSTYDSFRDSVTHMASSKIPGHNQNHDQNDAGG